MTARSKEVRRLLGAARRRLPKRTARPRWGNLRRQRPFSEQFGEDRGSPVDRHYIERFLGEHAGDVRGECLEVLNDTYTRRFGGEAVTSAEILDADPKNVRATILADLGFGGSLPEAAFDCFILTQTI